MDNKVFISLTNAVVTPVHANIMNRICRSYAAASSKHCWHVAYTCSIPWSSTADHNALKAAVLLREETYAPDRSTRLVNSLLPTDLREWNYQYYTQAFSYVTEELVLDRTLWEENNFRFVFPLFPSEKKVNVWDLRYMFRTNICSEKYNKTRYELRIKRAKITYESQRNSNLYRIQAKHAVLFHCYRLQRHHRTFSLWMYARTAYNIHGCTLGEHTTYMDVR